MTGKKKRGRPPLPKWKVRVQFNVRLSPKERRVIEAAAMKVGEPVTRWARNTLLLVAQP